LVSLGFEKKSPVARAILLQSNRDLITFPDETPVERDGRLFFLAGCAGDTPSAEEIRDQFERGLTGHGQIVPLDHTEQPNIDPRAGEPAPR